MTHPQPIPEPPRDGGERTIPRIIGEALLVLICGGVALGVAWEIGYPDIGWILAAVLWVCGAPALEISRLIRK